MDQSYLPPKQLMDGFENVLDLLKARGYLAQCNDEAGLRAYLQTPGRRFYIGFDPTADSLHIGHFMQMMIMAHMQSAGHCPISLIGGGTSMVGDPSGRTDMRPMMSKETIDSRKESFKKQFGIIVDFEQEGSLILDNADWLCRIPYLDFIREIGRHFSVNHMLAAHCYKSRLESGLTFLEFSYMLLQAYDFLYLFSHHDCRIQFGGDDQWSNILAGADLIRREKQEQAFVATFVLLTNSDGVKMGKTVSGALWLDSSKLPVFDFYQYWRNVDDAKVLEVMRLLTFTPLEEIRSYETLRGAELNPIKKLLAWRITALIHGKEAADQAQKQAEELFEGGGRSDNMESYELSRDALGELKILDFLAEHHLVPSKGEGRRLIQQKGISLNEHPFDDPFRVFTEADFPNGECILRRGKKKYYRILCK